MREKELRIKINIINRQLLNAINCDWTGQIIYCKKLIAKYEDELISLTLDN